MTASEEPKGLLYRPDLIDPDEEAALLDLLEELDFRELTMRGQTARRTVRLYGYDYDYEAGELRPGDPLPAEHTWLRDRCGELAGVPGPDLVQMLPATKALCYSITFRSLRRR